MNAKDARDDEQDAGTNRVLYLTTIDCRNCGNRVTYAHEGPWVPMDQSPPHPDGVDFCPECGWAYDEDGGDVVEVAEAERVENPEVEA